MDDSDDLEDSFISISDEEYAELMAKTQRPKSSNSPKRPATISTSKDAILIADVQQGASADFHGLYAGASDWKSKLSVIQAAYKYYLPHIMAAARAGHSIDPNIVTWNFSHIEDAAWCQIRALGLPFYPQFPVLGYFADFADPVRKIVIELDGKKFHKKEKDDLRDKQMRLAGWQIHRISSRIANCYLEDNFSEDTAFEIEEVINSEYPFTESNRTYLEMAESTLDGYLLLIRRRYYTKH